METFFNNIMDYINPFYLGSFMLLSYLIKRYFQTSLSNVIKREVKTVYIVLIIAAIVAIPFLGFDLPNWQRIFFSYTLGTSLHEVIFEWLEKRIKRKQQE